MIQDKNQLPRAPNAFPPLLPVGQAWHQGSPVIRECLDYSLTWLYNNFSLKGDFIWAAEDTMMVGESYIS